ncbi:hypothetical protein D3C75_682540 [compost metagenome]
MGKRFNCVFNQMRAVVDRNNFDTRGQTFLDFLKFGFYRIDGIQRIFAIAHDNNAASDFTFTVKLSYTPAYFRPHTQRGHIAQ